MSKQKCVIWGSSGAFLERTIDLIAEKYEIVAFVDNNSKLWGKEKYDIKIVSPWELTNNMEYSIVIAVNSFRGIDDIRTEIEQLYQKFAKGKKPNIDVSYVQKNFNIDLKDLIVRQHDQFWGANIKGTYLLSIIIKLLAVENYYECNNFGFDLHRKFVGVTQPNLMYQREENFIQLMKSFEGQGYNDSYPITLNAHYTIIDGTHRFACCIYHNLENINVRMLNTVDEDRKDLTWLKQVSVFTKDEINKIVSRYEKLRRDFNI